MASKMLSRLLPVAEGDVSVFDSIRRDAGMDLEGQGQYRPAGHFQDDDEDPEDMLYETSEQQAPFRDVVSSPQSRPMSQDSTSTSARTRPGWLDGPSKRKADEDEDVPESLLLENKGKPSGKRPNSSKEPDTPQARREAQWRTAQLHQKLHESQMPPPGRRVASRQGPPAVSDGPIPARANPRADAMWMYTNAGNMDAFFHEVYHYFVNHGVHSILLARVINQLTELFVFSFAMFLSTCVDFSKISGSKKSSDVYISKCMANAPWYKNVAIFLFVIYWCLGLVRTLQSVRRLYQLRDFFTHVLGIPEEDIQTVKWVTVVEGLVKIQNANIATATNEAKVKRYLDYNQPQQRLTAETVANRLMRQDNYYVALINKDIFDFNVIIPYYGSRSCYSRSLEWCIQFCLTNFIFDEQGNPRPFAIDVRNRGVLVTSLRRRLAFAAAISIIFAPWNIIRFSVMYFFRYYTDFTKNPARASMRAFTPLAEWKIREFNELDHLFQRRLRQAFPFANEYLKQFPKDKMDQLARFIAFISGAFAAVLTLTTLLDSKNFLDFEITSGRTALFYITACLAVFGIARGMLPDEYESHDPVMHLREVLMFLHYCPAHWKNNLHTNTVRAEFSEMYQMRVLIFLDEILSLILTPIILLQNAGKRSERVIDFFRETTVHIEGIGYQCNFAVFGMKKNQNMEDPATALQEPDGLRDDYYGDKDDKMAVSMHNFRQYYTQRQNGRLPPQGWQPPPAWPPMSPRTVADEGEHGAATAARHRKPAGSTLLDSRRHPPRSPQQRARAHPLRQTSDVTQRGVSESRLMAQDSDLDDYDRAVGRDASGLESDTDAEGGRGGVGKQGVLGMLAQYTKAGERKIDY